jgi:hypothetical protein
MKSRHYNMSRVFLVLCASLFLIYRRRRATRFRRPSLRRIRPYLSTVLRDLTAGDFRRIFRMERKVFNSLLCEIGCDLERDAAMALRSSGGRIEPEIRLAVTL